MRLTALVLSLSIFLGPVGASKADGPVKPFLVVWTVKVMDKDAENHDYGFSRDGGTVKVDTGDWKCSYSPVSVRTDGMYAESVELLCTAKKLSASTFVICGPREVSGKRTATLSITSGKNVNSINITCDPQG